MCWWWLINSLSGSSVMLFQTRRLGGLLEPWCPSLLADLDALSSCTVIRVATKTRTTPYRPSANGQVERMNRTILQILCCFIQGQQEYWDIHLATVGMAIRSTVNRQIGFTPNFLMLWREVLQHIDLMLNPGGEEERRTPGTYATRHQEATRTAHRKARQKLQLSQRRQKRDYDLRLEERKYTVDDAVYRFNRLIVLG